MRKNKLTAEQILYIVGDDNYSIVHLTTHKRVLLSHTLKWCQAYYPGFIRISKQALINPAYVVSWLKTSRFVASLTMQDNRQLGIARRRISRVLEQFELALHADD
ncbi:LytTR family transcriptional regulator [Spirosoma sp. HMF4905]|uniref:LytTR family transcriptional regulator n=1 Tax=Spirosoma arboris TaxID=2682092 RepID=A0A7K1SHH6_9BACT|nr:LytTR family DNA-binding domain-containing protein [Spirosoma arboris]MVM33269.1 LytTR family transcriptional regulator [Spirosoma arboris]